MLPSAPLLLSIILLAPTALSQLILPNIFRKSPSIPASNAQQQEPIMNIPNILVPPSKGDDDSSDSLSISDVIGKEKVISIFAGFTRDINSISERLNDGERNTTVLAPRNSAVQGLPRKPYVYLLLNTVVGVRATWVRGMVRNCGGLCQKTDPRVFAAQCLHWV